MNHLGYSVGAASYSLSFVSAPLRSGCVWGFPPHYTDNICISVYRLNIHEAFRCQEDSERRYHPARKESQWPGTGCHFSISPFSPWLLLILWLVVSGFARIVPVFLRKRRKRDVASEGGEKEVVEEEEWHEWRSLLFRVTLRLPETKDSAPLSLVKMHHSNE